MQPQVSSNSAGKIALRSGASVGILLGIIQSIISIVSTVQSAGTNNAGAFNTLLYLITPLIWIVGLLFTGAWASKITGKVGTGTLAGLFAGLFGGIVAGFGQAIASAISVNLMPASSSSTGLVLATGFAIIFYILLLAIGAGAGCGALGGLIGQTISDARPQAHQPVQPLPPVYQPPAVPYGYAVQPLPQTPMPKPPLAAQAAPVTQTPPPFPEQ